MKTKLILASDDVQRMVAACKAETVRQKCAATIAVVDDAGSLLYLERMDGPGPLSADVALGKARTAALTRQPTKAAEDRLPGRLGYLNVPGFFALQGGVPVTAQGQCVGAIGVSGGPTPQADEQIAAAGVAALAGGSTFQAR
jgi:glc operon protein GlcG